MGDAKTKSAPKAKSAVLGGQLLCGRRLRWVGYRRVAIVLLVLAAIALVTIPRNRLVHLHAGSGNYRLLVANTPSQQAKGLGARSSMPHDEGMLFPFASSGRECFWMKDMQFSLDIIWADSSKKITHIEPSLSPSTYPRSYCATGQYVIELNAGQVRASGLAVGRAVQF